MLTTTDFVLRVLLALVLGGVLGYEREKIGKSAGMRTYALVAIGATVFTMASAYGFGTDEYIDTSRIAAQIVVGIGFLGAGLILHVKNKVQGLTTASGLWVTAALGIIVGIGWYLPATILTVIIFLILFSASRFRIKTKRGWWKL